MQVLGQGRFGTVYKVDDVIALKVITVGSDKAFKNIALEEVERLMKLNRYIKHTFNTAIAAAFVITKLYTLVSIQ